MSDLIAKSGDLPTGTIHEALDIYNPRLRAWIEVSPQAIEANTAILKRYIKPSCSLMAVVKADGYGHGAETVARAAIRGGASSLGVATLQEGIQLRKAGVNKPVLILGNLIDAEDLRASFHWDLMPTLCSIREAYICDSIAQDSGKIFRAHLKFDTGMTRLGCDLKDANSLVEKIKQLENLKLEGLYSHLASADDVYNGQASQLTNLQRERFESVVTNCSTGSEIPCFHLANSAGTLIDRKLHFDMVRVGLSIYGYSPIGNQNLDLIPAMAVKARVTLLRNVAAGVGVSYGHSFITDRPTKLAVVAIGYADGVDRSLSGNISALLDGEFVPQVGAITMDQLILDATDHPGLAVGSVITIFGRDQGQCITPQYWSDISGSIPWEVLCRFKDRLPRVVI